MNTERGIDALDLESARVLWTVTTGQRPLLLLDNMLIAQVESRDNILRLAFLDKHTGARKQGITVRLPDGVRATIDDGSGASFRINAWGTTGELKISWSYSERPITGAAPDTSEIQAHRLQGTAQVDLDTWKVDLGAPIEDPLPPDLPATLAGLRDSGQLQYPIWHTDNIYATAVRTFRGEDERTVLKRWRAATGDSLPDVTLFAGRYTIQHPSADNRHLLASRLQSSPPAKYEWLVFALADGARIAGLHMGFPQAGFFVIGSLLVHNVQAQTRLVGSTEITDPPRIRAIDLPEGTERWVCRVRDTAYRGSLPPGIPEPKDSKSLSGSTGAVQSTEGE
jgi:hypothetical protein